MFKMQRYAKRVFGETDCKHVTSRLHSDRQTVRINPTVTISLKKIVFEVNARFVTLDVS